MAADSRRTVLADAGISTLAHAGSRGLTHRAVDRTAGVPEGSTSYYFRTRLDLLRAIVARLSDLDAASIPAVAHGTAEEFADGFAAAVHGLLIGGRERQLARYELALEGTRRPELRVALAAGTAPLRARLAEQLAGLGVPDPVGRARDMLTLLDGLLFGRLTGGDGAPPPRDEVAHQIRRILRAVGVPLPG